MILARGLPLHFFPTLLTDSVKRIVQERDLTVVLALGLTIVKHLVEPHGGNTYATSAGEGNGSTFSVHLPIAIHKDSFGRKRGTSRKLPLAKAATCVDL